MDNLFTRLYSTKAHVQRKHSSNDNHAFVFVIMAGIGANSPLQLNHQKIKTVLEYRTINIVTYHNRDHIYGYNEERSSLDKDLDPYKLVAALVDNPRNFKHEQTQSGVNSVAYETRFTCSIGEFKPENVHERGHISYIKILSLRSK